jgi:excisionase family DNA binding protein
MRTSKKQVEMMRTRGYVTAQEAADKLGHSPRHVARLVEEGRLNGTKVGARHYVALASVRAYLGIAKETP